MERQAIGESTISERPLETFLRQEAHRMKAKAKAILPIGVLALVTLVALVTSVALSASAPVHATEGGRSTLPAVAALAQSADQGPLPKELALSPSKGQRIRFDRLSAEDGPSVTACSALPRTTKGLCGLARWTG